MSEVKPKRKLKSVPKKVSEELSIAVGKTLVIEEEKHTHNHECEWKRLYEDLKERSKFIFEKIEEQRQKRNEASRLSKKRAREANKANQPPKITMTSVIRELQSDLERELDVECGVIEEEEQDVEEEEKSDCED